MTEQPLVSIIIPTYNRAHLIGETLDSVLAQTYKNWECIVVDDGSTDDTDTVMQEYCEKDARFKYYHRPEEHLAGGNGARNYGFKRSKGEYIQWFDSDDLMLPEKIELKVELIRNNSVNAVICNKDSIQDEFNKLLFEKDKVVNFNWLFREYALWRLPIITASVFFDRKTVEYYLFNEQIIRGQETEFYLKLFFENCTYKAYCVSKSLWTYRISKDSKTYKNKDYQKKFKNSLFYIYKVNYKRGYLTNDNEILNFYYKNLLKLFYRSFNNNHSELARKIFSFFLTQKTLNVRQYFKLILFLSISLVFNRRFEKLKTNLYNYKF